MRLFVGDFGPIGFVLLEDNGEDLFDLTGFTVTWEFANRDGSVPNDTPISGTVTNPKSGEVEFDLPASLTTSEKRYNTKITIVDGGKQKSSDGIILVDVDKN